MLAEVYATPKALIERLAEATKVKPDLKVLEGQEGREEELVEARFFDSPNEARKRACLEMHVQRIIPRS